jgi:tetratricopeptide (TPR) repeat protein
MTGWTGTGRRIRGSLTGAPLRVAWCAAARRGRLSVSLVLLVAIVSVVLHGCSLPPGRSGSGLRTVEIVPHTVSEGETLSSIAEDYYGSSEASTYLAEVNGVEADAPLPPGAVVSVPAGDEDIERYRRRTEAKIYYNRGTTLAEGGDFTGAKEAFTLALRTDPRFVDAGYNLGVVLMASGDPGRAVAVLEQVLAVRPDDPMTEFALGKGLYDLGRTEEALTHFEHAVTLEPDLEDAVFARAVALLKLGRRDEAVFALDGYLRRFPDGVWSDQARLELERMAGEKEGR